MTSINRRTLLGGAVLAPIGLSTAAAAAETPEQTYERRIHEDWPFLQRYAADNQALRRAGKSVDIVFMGDSITEGWRDKRPAFFGSGRVGRGISGQTTPQMVLRMMPDVVNLRPKAVHIMAGTNDVAGNTGPMTPEMTRDNIRAMTAIAQRHGIHVMLASIPPAASFPWRPGLETARPIREMNRWIEGYAREAGATWVNYDPVLATPAGGMRPGLAYDGVHPTEAGYDAMARVAEPVLKKVLKGRKGR